jgi:hypothetical protein
MSKIALTPDASGTGTFTIAAPNSNTNRTLTLPDATGILFSDADVASQAAAEAGTGTGLMTSERVEQHNITHNLGWGQTWQAPTRVKGTTYQNTTTRPIQVFIQGDNYTFQTSVDNITFVTFTGSGSSGFDRPTWAIIPPQIYYRAVNDGTGALIWRELR